ncbi:cytochrome P450 [Micromonospora sp. NPDC000089]|uniref:cytochrome P450 n=1 Tax=unclassified Micromonospora TaxID=2617518 RepID=UPI0036B8C14C
MTHRDSAAPPDVPPCGPPTPDADGGWSVTRYADVHAVLTDPAFEVPVAPPGPPGTLAWLRGAVARFSPAERHAGRRALAVAALGSIDPDLLRRDAARLTAELCVAGGSSPPAPLGRRALATPSTVEALGGTGSDPVAPLRGVPVRVLAAHLGLADPVAAVPAVAAVAAAYQPGADRAAVRRADDGVAALLALTPPEPPEALANRIGLLVQACDATAGLIAAAARYAPTVPRAVPTAALLAEVLRVDPPVRGTRRRAVTGAEVGGRSIPAGAHLWLRFDAANRDPARDPAAPPLTFGAGRHGCPGQRHALALAAGVVEAARAGWPAREEPGDRR